MITMNAMDKVTRGAAERAGQRVGAAPPGWPMQNRRICTVPDLPELDWAADHIG
jgi:hypothetical protein